MNGITAVEIAEPAQTDIANILDHSYRTFGPDARRLYQGLLQAAFERLAERRAARGSRQRPELGADVAVYHLRHARGSTVRPRDRVARPRHFLVYRQLTADRILILRVLHDTMDLARHLEADDGPNAH